MTREERMARIQDPYKNTVLADVNLDRIVVDRYNISKRDITQVFFSPTAYHNAVRGCIEISIKMTFTQKLFF